MLSIGNYFYFLDFVFFMHFFYTEAKESKRQIALEPAYQTANYIILF